MSTFDERAKDWDTPERIARAAEAAGAIRANVDLAPTDRVVDIGAGTGLLGLGLLDDIGELVLAEPSDGMLAVIGQKLAAADLPHVTAVKLDLVGDPPPGDPFDLAVSFLVLHHIEDTAAALAAVRRLLRPGGRMALSDLDTEDGTFHSAEAEGIHHLGFDRRASPIWRARQGSSRSRHGRRSTSPTRIAASRPSCCSAATPEPWRPARSTSSSRRPPRRPSPARSTGRAGARSGKTAASRSRRWPTTRRATRHRRRRQPGSPSIAGSTRVVERTGGGGGTDSASRRLDQRGSIGRSTAAEADRLAGLVEAAWTVFDRVAAAAPAELRKGPRGGGRDRDKMVAPRRRSGSRYAQVIGIKRQAARPGDTPAIETDCATAMLDVLAPPVGRLAARGPQVAAALRRPPDRVARARPRLGDGGPDRAR